MGWDVVGFEGVEPMDVKPTSGEPVDFLRWLNARRRGFPKIRGTHYNGESNGQENGK